MSFSTGTQPPPKLATLVKVWNSPPTLTALMVAPASTWKSPGLNSQSSAASLAMLPFFPSWARKSVNVVSPCLTQVPGPIAALKVAGRSRR